MSVVGRHQTDQPDRSRDGHGRTRLEGDHLQLGRGETVKLSSFGSFLVRKKKQRVGRNPKTGTEVPISPRRVIVFRPSAILKQQINGKPSGTKKSAVAELGSSPPG